MKLKKADCEECGKVLEENSYVIHYHYYVSGARWTRAIFVCMEHLKDVIEDIEKNPSDVINYNYQVTKKTGKTIKDIGCLTEDLMKENLPNTYKKLTKEE